MNKPFLLLFRRLEHKRKILELKMLLKDEKSTDLLYNTDAIMDAVEFRIKSLKRKKKRDEL